MRAIFVIAVAGAFGYRVHAAPAPGKAPDARERVVAAAAGYLAKGSFRGDCSSFVRAVFERAGVPLETARLPGRSASEAIFRGARPAGRPAPGDIAVFHNTYDRNGDGRINDRFTHIAVVETVDWPRVTLIHRGSAGITRVQMNLRRPNERSENSPLRSKRGKRRPGKILAGQLFAGFGSPAALGRRPAERRVMAAR